MVSRNSTTNYAYLRHAPKWQIKQHIEETPLHFIKPHTPVSFMVPLMQTQINEDRNKIKISIQLAAQSKPSGRELRWKQKQHTEKAQEAGPRRAVQAELSGPNTLV